MHQGLLVYGVTSIVGFFSVLKFFGLLQLYLVLLRKKDVVGFGTVFFGLVYLVTIISCIVALSLLFVLGHHRLEMRYHLSGLV